MGNLPFIEKFEKAKEALEQLKLDAKIRLTLLLEEFLHTVNVIHFFAKRSEDEFDSTSLASMFRKLEDIPKTITDLFEEIIKRYENFTESIEKIKKGNIDEHLIFKVFSEYLSYSFKEREILQEMDFTQTKLVSILDSFPRYYPSPKETNIRDATKIHFYLERISEDLLFIFKKCFKNTDDKVPAFFFWDFTPEINFIRDKKKFIVNSDVFLPNRQIYWIILAHEVFHYLYNFYKSEKSEDNLFWKMKKYADNWKVTLAIAFSRNNIRSSKFDPELYFIDVLIDVILTDIFSYKYAFPAMLYLFALDEGGSPSLPELNRIWTIRFRAILEQLNSKIEEEKMGIKKLFESFNHLFAIYKDVQKHYGFPNITDLYLEEEIIYITTSELVRSFFNDKEIKKKLDEVKNCINNLTTKKQPFWFKHLRTYLLTLEKYYDMLDENLSRDEKSEDIEKEYKEGRAFCRTLLEATLYGYEKVKDSEKEIKNYFEKPVYKFQFYRVRYDDNENNINKLYKALMGEENSLRKFVDAYCFGSYTFLYISKEEEYEKVSKYEKCGKDDNAWKNLERVVSSNQENVNSSNEEDLIRCPEIYLMNKLRFFRHDYSLTLYCGNEGNLVSILRNSKDYIYIFVKYNVNNVENFQEINDLFDKFKQKIEKHCEDISIFHFISFEWYDYLTLIVVKPSEKGIHLNNEVLKPLKEEVLINNDKKLGRTETDIFIGLNILDKVTVKTPHIHLRVASKDLGETKDKIIPALKGNFRVSLRFGIRDLVIKEKNREYFEDSFKNILTKVYKNILLNKKLKDKFSDIQFIVEVEN